MIAGSCVRVAALVLLGVLLVGGPIMQCQFLASGSLASSVFDSASEFVWSSDCSNASEFEYTSSWNTAWYGAPWAIIDSPMVSDGDEFTFPSIPVGTGWHGPVYVHELAESLLLQDLVEFTVNWSFTNDLTSLAGRYYVCLADTNQDPVVVFTGHDFRDWDYAGSYGGQYWFSNYTYYTFGTTYPHSFTEFSGTMRISYQPGTGIVSYVDGYGTGLITTVEQSDLEREMKYVVIMGGRSSSASLMPCYIDDIMVVSGTPGPAPFSWYEDCLSADRFQSVETWNTTWYGAPWTVVNATMVADGQFAFPAIPSADGWHGPVYVHELATAFQLGSLLQFSIDWSIDNSLVSYAGRYYVYLADASQNPIVVFTGHDFRDWEYAGAYGPQYWFSNYTYYAHGTPYPYSFTEFGGYMRAWYEPGIGIMGYCEGYDTGLISSLEQEDLEREIKYVVIMAGRASTYSLMPAYIDEIYILTSEAPSTPTTTTLTTPVTTTWTTSDGGQTTTNGLPLSTLSIVVTLGALVVVVVVACMTKRGQQ